MSFVRGPASTVPMLTHFTRASRNARALDNLISILSDGVVRASPRMIRGGRPAVCLVDAPMAELRTLLARRNRRRYEPCGVAVEKTYAFRMGARPVIYLPWREAERILPGDEQWRIVSLELDCPHPVDWSFEREWRIAGDLPLDQRRTVALVEDWHEAEEIFDRFDGRPPCAGVIPLNELLGA
jgi:hypothetical protein